MDSPDLGLYQRRKDGLKVEVVQVAGAWVRVHVEQPRRRTWEVMLCNFWGKYEAIDNETTGE